jgi:hypothetical protein
MGADTQKRSRAVGNEQQPCKAHATNNQTFSFTNYLSTVCSTRGDLGGPPPSTVVRGLPRSTDQHIASSAAQPVAVHGDGQRSQAIGHEQMMPTGLVLRQEVGSPCGSGPAPHTLGLQWGLCSNRCLWREHL